MVTRPVHTTAAATLRMLGSRSRPGSVDICRGRVRVRGRAGVLPLPLPLPLPRPTPTPTPTPTPNSHRSRGLVIHPAVAHETVSQRPHGTDRRGDLLRVRVRVRVRGRGRGRGRGRVRVS